MSGLREHFIVASRDGKFSFRRGLLLFYVYIRTRALGDIDGRTEWETEGRKRTKNKSSS